MFEGYYADLSHTSGNKKANQPIARRCVIVLDILICSFCNEKCKIKYSPVHIPQVTVSKTKQLAQTRRSIRSLLQVYLGKQAVSAVIVSAVVVSAIVVSAVVVSAVVVSAAVVSAVVVSAAVVSTVVIVTAVVFQLLLFQLLLFQLLLFQLLLFQLLLFQLLCFSCCCFSCCWTLDRVSIHELLKLSRLLISASLFSTVCFLLIDETLKRVFYNCPNRNRIKSDIEHWS